MIKVAQLSVKSVEWCKEQFYSKVVSEWNQCYINFIEMEPCFNFAVALHKRYNHSYKINNTVVITYLPISKQNAQILDNCDQYCVQLLKLTYQKEEEIIYNWGLLTKLILQGDLLTGGTHDVYERRHSFKIFLKAIYAQIIYLKLFKQLNVDILFWTQNLYKRYFSQLRQCTAINICDKIKPSQLVPSITHIQQICTTLFSLMAHNDPQQSSKITGFVGVQKKAVSVKNYFLLGLYSGVGTLIIIALTLLIALNLDNSIASQHISLQYIFPMFRGVGLLIMYSWGMAWNVYGFTEYRINFRAILQYGSHYSTYFQLMKRASFFTIVFVTMMLLYLIGLSLSTTSLPLEYTPLVVWALYFSYIFFPNRRVFNPRGRQYFYTLVKRILLSFTIDTTFVLSYTTDQMVSFVIPIRDFAYTVCYYTSSLSQETAEYKDCLNSQKIDGIVIAYIVALIPLSLRMIQCYKATRGHFFGHLQMYNFFKYFASVMTISLSFFTTYTSSLVNFFIVSSVFSTLYSYYWDLKHDWGFLQPNCGFLRNHLAYHNRRFYYAAICTNLILRCSWTLTLAPTVIRIFPKATYLPFLTSFLQIFRRCLWNFFRIQKQHVLNCYSFSVVKNKPQQIILDINKPLRQIDRDYQSGVSYAQINLKKIFQEENNQTVIGGETVLKTKQTFLQALSREKEFIKNKKLNIRYNFDFRDKYH